MTKPPISPEILDALRQIDSPTVSNAIEHFKFRDPAAGYATMELRCQFPELNPMVGYAVTCTADTTTPGDTRPARFADVLDAVVAAPKPAVLVIKHAGPDRLRSCFVGDMSCTALWRLGAVGVVTDGGNRDRSGIHQRAPELQLFSPGWVVSHGYGAFIDINVTVSICGLTIRPGDLLHGDESGLLTIPLDIVEPVLKQAEAMRDAEAEFFDFLLGDAFDYEELKRRVTLH
jgi:regulator of RNase E activity RraA